MPYTEVTLLDLRNGLQNLVESVPFWNVHEANAALNEALKVWNCATGQFKGRVIVLTTAFTVWYATPSTMLYPFRMTWQSQPMHPDSVVSMDSLIPNWEGLSTISVGVPTRPTIWIPCGINRFAIWPADAAGETQLAIDGVMRAPVLNDDDDTVDLGREEQDAVLSYGLHYLIFKEGGARFQGTLNHYKRFMEAAGKKNARLKASTFYRSLFKGHDLARKQKRQEVPA